MARGLRQRAVRIAEQSGDDIGCSLAARLGDPLKALCVLALDPDEDEQLGPAGALREGRAEPPQVSVKIARLGSATSQDRRASA